MRLDLAECLEWAQVMFRPCLETHVSEIGCIRDYGTEHVAEHGAVDFAVLGFGGSVGPRHVEDVGDVDELGEHGLGLFGIRYIALDVLDEMIGVPVGLGAPGHSVHFPWAAGRIGQGQDLGQAVAHDSGDAHYQAHALVASCRLILFEFLLQNQE